ncbi:MAG: D-alanyl-D-alanine carboxypeptidase/D-alanyl-D-alanine-endopeptidase [Bacteroidia bacterium]|nr:D-alanyl-D-alanine carboxypeptidase/D-alanyl-D-alanine-endopeptidase [Bacteroidia bacterium]
MLKVVVFLIVIIVIPNVIISQNITNEGEIDFNKTVNEFVLDSTLLNSSISFYAIDLNTNKEIGKINPDLRLSPASTLKLFTTAAALEILGGDYTFITKIGYSGSIDASGVLNGNIIIKGGGDPCFMSHNFNSTYYETDIFSKIAAEITKTGIKKINGSVIADANYYSDNTAPSTWILADVANYYGASPWALSVLDNEYKLFFKTGPKSNDSTEIIKQDPEIPFMQLENTVISDNISGDQSVIYGGQYDDYRIATGRLPVNKANYEVKGSISNPPLLVAIILYRELLKNGINVSDSLFAIPCLKFKKNISKDYKSIYEIESPRLKDIIYFTNIKSINLYAEHLLRQIGVAKSGVGSNSSGIDALNNFWYKTTGKLLMYDGSGLSRFNAVSAKQLVNVLSYMKKSSKNYELFYNSLPIASKSGSLSSMFSGSFAENNLRAKSGYMTGVRSYAGYVKTKSSKNIAFAIIINNYSSNPSVIKGKIEQFLIKLSNN